MSAGGEREGNRLCGVRISVQAVLERAVEQLGDDLLYKSGQRTPSLSSGRVFENSMTVI